VGSGGGGWSSGPSEGGEKLRDGGRVRDDGANDEPTAASDDYEAKVCVEGSLQQGSPVDACGRWRGTLSFAQLAKTHVLDLLSLHQDRPAIGRELVLGATPAPIGRAFTGDDPRAETDGWVRVVLGGAKEMLDE